MVQMGWGLVKRRIRTHFLLWIRMSLLCLSFMPFMTCGETTTAFETNFHPAVRNGLKNI